MSGHIKKAHTVCTMSCNVQENWTALMAASRNGRFDAVKVLLQHHADPNMQDHVSIIMNSWILVD